MRSHASSSDYGFVAFPPYSAIDPNRPKGLARPLKVWFGNHHLNAFFMDHSMSLLYFTMALDLNPCFCESHQIKGMTSWDITSSKMQRMCATWMCLDWCCQGRTGVIWETLFGCAFVLGTL